MANKTVSGKKQQGAELQKIISEIGDRILLSKVFTGGFITDKGNEENLAGESVSLLRADNGELYSYFVPHGDCPKDIGIYVDPKDAENGKSKSVWGRPKEKHFAKYMLDVEEDRKNGTITILCVHQLKQKMHRYSAHNRTPEQHNAIELELVRRGALFNGIPLSRLHEYEEGVDRALLVTFMDEKIFTPEIPVCLTLTDYKFYRNPHGIICPEKYPESFKSLDKAIKSITSGHADKILKASDAISHFKDTETLLDRCGKTYDETCYTGMLNSVLKRPGMLKSFCRKFCPTAELDSDEFVVQDELSIVGGRMDICAYTGKQRIVIENKVLSGLNGKKKDKDSRTQLSEYWYWCTFKVEQTQSKRVKIPVSSGRKIKPLCFIAAPDYRCQEIRSEVEKYHETMLPKWIIIGYGDIANFIEENKGRFPNDTCIDSIVNAFRNLSLPKREVFANRLVRAIMSAMPPPEPNKSKKPKPCRCKASR